MHGWLCFLRSCMEFCVWSGCFLWLQSRAWRWIFPYNHELLLEGCAISPSICSIGLSRDHFHSMDYETSLGSTNRCYSSRRVSVLPLFHLCRCYCSPENIKRIYIGCSFLLFSFVKRKSSQFTLLSIGLQRIYIR